MLPVQLSENCYFIDPRSALQVNVTIYAQPEVLSLNYSYYTVSVIVATNTTLYSKSNELDKTINTIYTAQGGGGCPDPGTTLPGRTVGDVYPLRVIRFSRRRRIVRTQRRS